MTERLKRNVFMLSIFRIGLTACLFASVTSSGWAQEKGYLFAHRGGAHEFEENTMDAFRASYAAGIRGFETDVRITKDGELVILHDDSLERTHHATGPVEHKTAAELREIKTKGSGQDFLFLDELLDFLADKPGFYLELEMKTSNKNLYSDEQIMEYARKIHAAAAREPEGSFYVLTSFDERPIRALRQIDPEVDAMFITGKHCSPELIAKAKELGIKRIACRMEGTTRAAVKEAQKEGLRVTGWPGHSIQDYHLALGLGVDGICTDIPCEVLKYQAKTK